MAAIREGGGVQPWPTKPKNLARFIPEEWEGCEERSSDGTLIMDAQLAWYSERIRVAHSLGRSGLALVRAMGGAKSVAMQNPARQAR
jgi:hypothetical protein